MGFHCTWIEEILYVLKRLSWKVEVYESRAMYMQIKARPLRELKAAQ